jgi:hypothetical protein
MRLIGESGLEYLCELHSWCEMNTLPANVEDDFFCSLVQEGEHGCVKRRQVASCLVHQAAWLLALHRQGTRVVSHHQMVTGQGPESRRPLLFHSGHSRPLCLEFHVLPLQSNNLSDKTYPSSGIDLQMTAVLKEISSLQNCMMPAACESEIAVATQARGARRSKLA